MAIALVASGLFNVGMPLYYWQASKAKDQVVVFDLASGSLLLSPLVDPSDSKDILEVEASWAAKCILDRSPSGLDDSDLLNVLFNSESARKVREEFDGVHQQYLAKSLRSHVEIKTIDTQAIATSPQGPYIKARVTGQVVITGVLNGSAIQDLQNVVLDITLVRNPDLARVHRYPLCVFAYQYANQNVAKK